MKDAVAQLADKFQLSDEQRNAKYKSGSNVFYITVRGALTRFLKDGTLEQPEWQRDTVTVSAKLHRAHRVTILPQPQNLRFLSLKTRRLVEPRL